ncbi:nitrogenase component 1 [Desulfoluna butyratoxydans]|uniref:Nitrogenase/oxidoreductase component 1 n=1 Tax=Desulfoluna butyratoxydans TaxID=231438 RepID=A0A4U8YR57_9BACT|nr:nitrogenase component 1 [Desulfoluna butyratoxydans]VFQ46825.1 nitrogenase/oxidoreductase component 1 [Desulfoluna butyratoxydans]
MHTMSRLSHCCEPGAVLSPVTDALHLVYGDTAHRTCPVPLHGRANLNQAKKPSPLSVHLTGVRGLSQERRMLYRGLTDLIDGHHPAAAFVYPTGKGERLGDEVDAVCSRVEEETGIPVIPVHSEDLKGKRKAADRAACQALFRLMGTGDTVGISPASVNILAGPGNRCAAMALKRHCRELGTEVVAVLPGCSSVAEIRRSHGASLNLVVGDGAMLQLALMMEVEYGIPLVQVSGDTKETVRAALAVMER